MSFFGLVIRRKVGDLAIFVTCVVGIAISAAILFVHGSAQLLLSYPAIPPQTQVSGAVDAILKVSAERRSLLLELKAALLSQQNNLALKLARKYCGIEDTNAK